MQSFSDGTARRIDSVIEDCSSADESPVAVFDADGTLWADDVGEDFFKHLLERRLLNLEEGTDHWALYEAACAVNKAEGYGSLGPIMKGLREHDLIELAEDFVDAHYASKIFPAQATLMARLRDKGWSPWVVSASNRWIAAAGARLIGFPRDRVVGVDVKVLDGVLSGELIAPVPCYEGKALLVESKIGRKPRIAVGNAMTDLDMLECATDLVIVINPDERLTNEANARGWAIERWG